MQKSFQEIGASNYPSALTILIFHWISVNPNLIPPSLALHIEYRNIISRWKSFSNIIILSISNILKLQSNPLLRKFYPTWTWILILLKHCLWCFWQKVPLLHITISVILSKNHNRTFKHWWLQSFDFFKRKGVGWRGRVGAFRANKSEQ